VELGFGFDQAALEGHLTDQPSLLIIDGLDEIFDLRRRRLMVEQVIGLAGLHPKLRLIVTSRIAGFDEHPFRAAGFALATLIDLTAEQIENFARAWFTIVFPGDSDSAARARDDLLGAVATRPQLRAIAGNPMILTIMATVARHRRLGRSRAALYAQALELLPSHDLDREFVALHRAITECRARILYRGADLASLQRARGAGATGLNRPGAAWAPNTEVAFIIGLCYFIK
jgi:predicted NACHT family NTPase